MADSLSFGKVELVASLEEAEAPAEPLSETPFRILVIGDFSGRANRGSVDAGPGLAARRPLRVDREDLDRVLAGLGVEIRLPVAGEDSTPIVLRFRELEDFHPDRIYQRVDAFQALRDLRTRLSDPRTAAQALRQLGGAPAAAEPPRPAATPGVSESPAPEGLLDQILAETRARTAPGSAPASSSSSQGGEWAPFLARITAPHRVEAADPRLPEMVAAVDEATGELMAEILHHPDFQGLEAAWRSLDFLVRRLDTDEHLTISLLDATRAELDSGLPDEIASAGPWAVIVGDLTFDANARDVALLGRLAESARRAGAPFLAGAGPRFVGSKSVIATPDPDDWNETIGDEPTRAAWSDLRGRPEAAYVGLAMPRVLLRVPYGQAGEPIEGFAFEEANTAAGFGSFLGGNPAFLLALLLGQAFGRSGWQVRPGEVSQVDGLPYHVAGSSEDAVVLPCAGVSLSDRAAEVILDHGIMPLLCPRDGDFVRVARFQSIAEPPTPLAGRWRQ